jgi:hypothetical protein
MSIYLAPSDHLHLRSCRPLVCRCRRASTAVVGGPIPLHATYVTSTTPTTGDDNIPTHATLCRQRMPLASTTYPLMLCTGPFLGLPVACLSKPGRLKICTSAHTTPLLTHVGGGVDALRTYKRKHSVQCKRRDLLLRCSSGSS